MVTKAILGGVVGAVLVYAGLAGTRPEEAAAASVSGCLRTGSAPSVFLLRGGRVAGEEGGARDFLLVSVPSGVNLGGALNHQVSIDGDVFAAAEGPEPPAAANTVEKALRRLAVRSMSDSGTNCS